MTNATRAVDSSSGSNSWTAPLLLAKRVASMAGSAHSSSLGSELLGDGHESMSSLRPASVLASLATRCQLALDRPRTPSLTPAVQPYRRSSGSAALTS
eukprot:CAMPEP_0197878078 /NCGR_PEP_ID=MMETSP1439-20131203/6563_1 /TAXON_ID=66791 /ORGANISM="Gonyaulax spinifera, Strain CCMP409" /LENGTH=97 /DNA_ID=CAMNT_0043497459 /DNA_START=338 /DNA_END=631 /DNA_ORIENTATION=-